MLLGISGKKGHGKDTIAKMIQYLMLTTKRDISNYKITYEAFASDGYGAGTREVVSNWENKKFAGKLKQIVSILIGCTVEELENEEFKSKELGEEWSCYLIPEAESKFPRIFPIDIDIKWIANGQKYFKRKMTPRMLLQLLGTECGRQIIHPNIWINGLMNEYTEDIGYSYEVEKVGNEAIKIISEPTKHSNGFPNWIISDVRFPDEAKAIKDKAGLVVRVNNSRVGWTGNHESETAMDNYSSFDRIFDNSGTLGDLQGQVKEFLENYKLI